MARSRMFLWDENPSPPYLPRPFAYLEQSLVLMQRAPEAEIMSSHDMLNRLIVHRLIFPQMVLDPEASDCADSESSNMLSFHQSGVLGDPSNSTHRVVRLSACHKAILDISRRQRYRYGDVWKYGVHISPF